ncbi:MAG: YicC family protein [Oscillospiraceae bacterium]|nr:YicC family protein [Oscillospiraceae bacterium]
MIKSMTGYGSAKGKAGDLEISVELKSVNNRYLDASVRMPRSFLFAEDAVKSAIGRHISRGKVDMFINVDSSAADDMSVKVNEPLLRGYLDAIRLISEKYGLENDLSAVSAARFPDILSVEKKDLDADALSAGIVAIAEEALKDFDAMRQREGEKLCADVLSKLETISSLVETVEREAPKTVEAYQNRLREKMNEVLSSAGVDENRILAEAAIFADRVAVDEETVRLRSHMSQLRTMLAGGSPIGRKIDFLIQEFNREANTIGSKCQNSDIAHVVVELKSEIEKIREQIQNIE